jgi:hypothetical protein
MFSFANGTSLSRQPRSLEMHKCPFDKRGSNEHVTKANDKGT